MFIQRLDGVVKASLLAIIVSVIGLIFDTSFCDDEFFSIFNSE